jgi:hypothetical protein
MAPNESIAKESTILFCGGACSGNRNTKLAYLKLLLDYPVGRQT